LAASLLALHTGQRPGATFYFSTAGVILVVAVIEAGYALAYRDELTRLPGRRALNEALQQTGGDYAVAMVDVDHFKKFNDTYGHDVGDQVLKMVAGRLDEVTGGGRAFRYGGEEFSVLFQGKTVDEALPHLDLLRATIADTRFTLRGADRPRKKPGKPRGSASSKQVAVTVSIGVAEASERASTPDEVIKAADKALYRAKKGGRNQVKT
jgi:diguanylate cyclase (GGDEF)-like protein